MFVFQNHEALKAQCSQLHLLAALISCGFGYSQTSLIGHACTKVQMGLLFKLQAGDGMFAKGLVFFLPTLYCPDQSNAVSYLIVLIWA